MIGFTLYRVCVWMSVGIIAIILITTTLIATITLAITIIIIDI